MRLQGAVTQESGAINEDGFGTIGPLENISAAWIFDGVTGINGQHYLPGSSDAKWLVERAHSHLLKLSLGEMLLADILSALVEALVLDWSLVSADLHLPPDYDPPAACLTMVKRYGRSWQAVRLGDSSLLAQQEDGSITAFPASSNNSFDRWISAEANKRRAMGINNVSELMAEFRPHLLAARNGRNTADGYSILEADPVATRFAEFLHLGEPTAILLCTDGFYRAVDHYGLYNDPSLMARCMERDSVVDVLKEIRVAEASDPLCEKYFRFKAADDATALALHI